MAPTEKLPGLWNHIMAGSGHKIWLGIGIMLFLLLSVHTDSVEGAGVGEFCNDTITCDPGLTCDTDDTCKKNFSEQCNSNNECASNLQCATNCVCESTKYWDAGGSTCEPKKTFSEQCNSNNECGSNLQCATNCVCESTKYWDAGGSTCALKKTFSEQCNSNNECGSNLQCATNCVCESTKYWDAGGSTCALKKTFSEQCNSNNECGSNLQCATNCVCESTKYWDAGGSTCAPKKTFSEQCNSNNECGSNLQCATNCVCESTKYWDAGGSTCEPKKTFSEQCNSNNECGSNLQCATNCVCESTKYWDAGGFTCEPKKTFSEQCNSNNECGSNLQCATNCVCESTKYWDAGGSTCEPKKTFNDQCNSNNECGSNLQCATNCVCESTKYWDAGGSTCELKKTFSEQCNSNNECGSNLQCATNCVCESTKYWDAGGSTCEPKKTFNDQCNSNNECGSNLQCATNCVCESTKYWDAGGSTCELKKTFSEQCNSNNECGSNLQCATNCVCESTKYWDAGGSTCEPKKTFNDQCNSNNECGSNLQCATNCVCESTKYWDAGGSKCESKKTFSEQCNSNNECGSNLQCATNCVCESTKYWDAGGSTCAQKKTFNDQCNSNNECGSNLQCATNCVCESTKYWDAGGSKCEPKKTFNDQCNSNNECGSNLQCATNCVCESTKYWDADGSKCEPKKTFNDQCNSNNECGSNLQCATNCVCESTKYWDAGGSKCEPKKTFNDQCNSNNECGSNLQCATNCVCESTKYWDAGGSKCEPKKTFNDQCNSNNECGSNLQCDTNCVCESTEYWDAGGSTCEPKKSHQAECPNGNECQDVLTCTSRTSGDFCLCDPNQFWYSQSNSCLPVDNLKVADVQISKTTVSVNLTWTSTAYGLGVKFDLVWNNQAKDQDKDISSPKTVSKLIPGTQYNYALVAYLSGDAYYDKRSTTYDGTVTTDPAQPGAVDPSISQLSSNPMTIRFGPSDGLVKNYVVELSRSEGGSSESKSTTTTEVEFYLPNAVNYNYVITAYNTEDDASEPRTGDFTTNSAPSTPVTNLAIEHLTSNNVTVTWTLPVDPKGAISEFFVQVSDGGTMECIQLYTLACSNCTQNSTRTTPSPCQENFTGSTFTAENVEKGSDHVFSQLITSLAPYKFYKVNVYAFNEAGKGDDNETSFTTLEDMANNIESIQVTPGRDDVAHQVYLNVTLSPGIQTGLTNFTVTLKNATDDSEVKTHDLMGYSDTTLIFTDLLAFHNYRVSAYAETKVGRSPEIKMSEIVKTSVNKPGSVRKLYVQPDSKVATKFTLTLECPPQNERNGTVQSVSVTKTPTTTLVTRVFQFDMQSECQWTLQSDDLGSFAVSQNYTFFVTVKNQEFISDPSETVYFFADPKAPIFDEGTNLLIDDLPQAVSSETSIQVKVDASRLTDESQGAITIVGLIVCVESDQNLCDDSSRTKRSNENTNFYLTYAVWAQSEAGDFRSPYRATPQDWLQNSQSDTYTIGGSSNCPKGVNVNTYCNGPLPSGRDVVVTAFSCTSGGCERSLPYISRTKASDSSDNAGLIAGVVVGVVVVLVIAVLVIVFILRRRRGRPKSMERLALPVYSAKESRSIPIRKFQETVARYHKDANLLFQGEFEDIKTQSSQVKATTNAALKEENRVKNRYVDILPYDHSRVKLQVQEDNDDYINANYIPGFSSPREYIATQGPMHSTIPHFWRMVWEQKSTVIVMLSDLTESNKLKVSLYWPENLNEPIRYGEVLVEMTNFSQLNKYIIRNFRISFGNQSRRVTHFFIPGWWDFSANLIFNDVLEFAQLVRKEATPPDSGLVVVHCSAGVGRTGTFIALDYFMQYIDKHGLDADIDVFSYVMSMRENRPRMVQAEAQYIFIFDALAEVIERKLKAEQEHLYDNNPDHIYKNIDLTEDNIYVNTANGAEDHTYANQAFVGDSDGSPSKPTTVL